jgi:hypothetical protein
VGGGADQRARREGEPGALAKALTTMQSQVGSDLPPDLTARGWRLLARAPDRSTTMPTRTRHGPASYSCAELVAITTWLIAQGYCGEDARSQHEYLRLRRAKSLIIVYHNGTCLLQGADITSAHELLSGLVPCPTETELLPF